MRFIRNQPISVAILLALVAFGNSPALPHDAHGVLHADSVVSHDLLLTSSVLDEVVPLLAWLVLQFVQLLMLSIKH